MSYTPDSNKGTTAAKPKDSGDPEYNELKNNGEIFRAEFLKKTKRTKIGEIFYATGRLIGPMPKSMFKKRKYFGKIVKDNVRMNNLISQIPAYLEKQLLKELALEHYKEDTNPNPKLVRPPLLDYTKLSLLQYIPDETVCANTLQKLLNMTNPKPKKQVTSEFEKEKEKEKIKARIRKTLIRIGLDYHISAPLERFTPAMGAKDHLTFLKDHMSLKEWGPELQKHFDQVKEKAELMKNKSVKSIVFAELAVMETDETKKIWLFDHARAEASMIKTDDIREKAFTDIEIIAIGNIGISVAQNTGTEIAQSPLKDKVGIKSKPATLMTTSKHDLLLKADTAESALTRSRIYEVISIREEDPQHKERYYKLSFAYGRLIKTPKAKTLQMISLRDNAVNEKWQANAQELIKEGPYSLVIEDLVTAKNLSYKATKIAVSAVEEGRIKSVANQKVYAKENARLGYNYWSNV